jgi:xylulokinase
VTTEPLVLGIDIGTSGAKVLVVDVHGAVLASSSVTYPCSTPRSGWSEQAPEDWVTGTLRGIKKVLTQPGVDGQRVGAIGLTGQMHGLVALDDERMVIRPAILWNDQRSAGQCLETEASLGLEFLLEHTGNRMLAGFTAPKLLWMREHEPDAFARVRHVLLPKDYVRLRLGSELASDVSDASGTSVFNCGKRTWSNSMLDALELPLDWWPDAAESSEVVDRLDAGIARELGLPPGIPLVAGAGDQAASAVGTGIVEQGVISATLGTSGVVFASSDTWRTTPEGSLHAFCHAVPGTWHLMGVMLSAAGSFEWFNRAITPDIAAEARDRGVDPYDELCRRAATVEPGSNGLFFLPYLTGERTPHVDPDARGCFIGLTPGHDRDHMARAVLEGVTYGLRDCLDLVRATGVHPDSVRLSGGGAKGPFWRQLCADIFGCATTTTTTTEGTAFGGAILAGVGGGLWPDVPTACARVIKETDHVEPGSDCAGYEALHKDYHRLYPALRGWWSDR